MITDVDGVRVGHWTDEVARTGCTVVLFPADTVGSAEVRGGAPATRELDVLAPERLVDRVDAVLLTGGSAFGLWPPPTACCGGARSTASGSPPAPGRCRSSPRWRCSTSWSATGRCVRAPTRATPACAAAPTGPVAIGAVGAGTGATVDKWQGPEHVGPGGLGSATVRHGDLVVERAGGGQRLRRDRPGRVAPSRIGAVLAVDPHPVFGNTTIGVIATNARLDQGRVPAGRPGRPRRPGPVVVPAHTAVDGDALVAVATGRVDGVARRRPIAASPPWSGPCGACPERATAGGANPGSRLRVGTTLRGVSTPLEALAVEASTCTRCALAEGRTQVVFGMGDPTPTSCSWAKGPGPRRTARACRSSAGPGQLLDRLMQEEMGMHPARACYIVNDVRCRPPGNRDPQPEEIDGVLAVARGPARPHRARGSSSPSATSRRKLLLDTEARHHQAAGPQLPVARRRARPDLPPRGRAAGRRHADGPDAGRPRAGQAGAGPAAPVADAPRTAG